MRPASEIQARLDEIVAVVAKGPDNPLQESLWPTITASCEELKWLAVGRTDDEAGDRLAQVTEEIGDARYSEDEAALLRLTGSWQQLKWAMG